MRQDEYWMLLAICEAKKGLRKGEIPVGVVIVKDDRIIAKEHNQTSKNPVFHAEMLAILKSKPEDLVGSSVYITMEPCIMCSGALVLSRVKEIIFSVENEKFGGAYSLYQIPLDSRLNHTIIIRKGPYEDEIRSLLSRYFLGKRRRG